MKDRKEKPRVPILAAGGIVLRGERRRQIAVVQLRKMDAWVLPKGKLADGEDVITAARREVLEETGHQVAIHEFLGTLAYEAGGRPKVVQFWRMQALDGPVGPLMRDVRAVQWLALDAAIERLTHAREQAFLEQVGPAALKAAEQPVRRTVSAARPSRKRPTERAQTLPAAIETAERFVPVEMPLLLPPAVTIAAPTLIEPVRSIEPIRSLEPVRLVEPVPSVEVEPAPPAELAPPAATEVMFIAPTLAARDERETAEAAAARTVLERTWVWLRYAAQPLAKRSAG